MAPWVGWKSNKKVGVRKLGNGEHKNKAVAACLDSDGDCVGGSSLVLCLWAKISNGPWMVCSNLIQNK